ncbi:MAG: DEAD/DEAH box helicase [Gemmatimonadetes bacterium]|jgi:ATP-dependent RNA helicase DeaD|nr:DEAD/DEAH box helicase [Gemmatimonadota bacterium]MBT5142478.1 DEAD/DEAH box helicase [Gemmatimonadota bacterium]MBT5586408.1 DEAD/DEAH box helicase [Gemmatimonadota bacterium]MBT5961225.1 DEAD/DEAH box helicase [Gemmatimonadota bacterium]MBT7453226.1 DEAD/DEAH box helicase [Gemmatimonadota bacterium]
MAEERVVTFKDLSLAKGVLEALSEVGYEIPTPIQAQTIPLVLAGRDLLGQAQTGTGKTAAFALPLLSRIDLSRREVQVLVLTPTRELAIQVSEAFQRYAAHLKGFHVLPIYGGQAYDGQLRSLKRGVHVVVGTPGRMMDHMRRKSLRLDRLSCLVLDEADEMLRMGFIDDVEWILEQTPAERQTALFSATMPAQIRRIAAKYLREPEHITIVERTTVAETIEQHHWMVAGREHKIAALTRILDAENFDGVLVFVRTRTMTVELAEKLAARGYGSAALSGEMAQHRREQTVGQLKKGQLDILVATDVAARGLDIDRISHVINFDIPHDAEAYIHRIGRTGRAGRLGKAISFVAPRERRLLHTIERATKQKIPLWQQPSTEAINDQRIARFTQALTDVLAVEDLGTFRMVLEQYMQEHNVPALEIASALARMVQGDEPLLLAADVDHPRRGKTASAATANRPNPNRPSPSKPRSDRQSPGSQSPSRPSTDRPSPDRPNPKHPAPKPPSPSHVGPSGPAVGRSDTAQSTGGSTASAPADPRPRGSKQSQPEATHGSPAIPSGMERFRAEVGRSHGVKPGNLMGAISNEAVLDSAYIGRIEIFDDYSTIDLPEGMGGDLLRTLKKVRVCGQRLRLARLGSEKRRDATKGPKGSKGGKPKNKHKKSKHRKGNKPNKPH